MDLTGIGKLLMIGGGLAVLAGAALWIAGKAGLPLGALPGDIRAEREHVSFYFPVVSCIVISIVLTIVLNLIGRFFK